MSGDYDDFIGMAESLMIGLNHILDAADIASVDGVVANLAIQLGENPERWHGAGNIALVIAESLIGDDGPWTMSEAQLRANTVITCFILVRLMVHPMMQPIIRSWEQDSRS